MKVNNQPYLLHYNSIVEDAQAYAFGKLNTMELAGLAMDLGNGIPVYLLKKESFTTFEGDLRQFNEGMTVTDKRPNEFSLLGSYSEKAQVGHHFVTMTSVEFQPKQNTELPFEHFGLYDTFERMFGACGGFTNINGRIYADNPAKLLEAAKQWYDSLSELDGTPMKFVLETHYSVADIMKIRNAAPQRVERWIADLEQLLTVRNEFNDPSFELPFLAKGLTGSFRSIRHRVRMRLNFWKQWNLERNDILLAAQNYRPIYQSFKKAA